MNSSLNAVVCAAAIVTVAANARADVTIIIEEVGNDVVMTGSGSFNLDSFTGEFGTQPWDPYIDGDALVIGPSQTVTSYLLFGLDPRNPMIYDGPQRIPDASTGDTLGFFFIDHTQRLFIVPQGYTSGAPLSGTSTFFNTSLDSLGIESGAYRMEWTNISGTEAIDFFATRQPTGACCVGDACLRSTEFSCTAAGGTYSGDGSLCSDVTCPPGPVTGACCLPGGACIVSTEADCTAAGGTYSGDDVECASANCPAPCPADITDSKGGGPDGVVNLFDLLALLDAWGNCLP